MRTAIAILLTASPAAAQYPGAFFTLSGGPAPALHRINPDSGVVAESILISGHESLRGGIAYNSNGWLYTIDGPDDANPDRLLRIDTLTGIGTVIGQTGFNWQRHALFWPNFSSGPLYAIGDNAVYTINPATGQATLVAALSGSPRLDQVTALAAHTYGNIAFITDATDTDLFSVSLITGQVAWIGSIGGSPFTDLTFFGTSALRGVRAGGIYSIDTTTAIATLLYPGNYSAIDHAYNGAPWCYANCDGSTTHPVLTPNDLVCFMEKYAKGDPYWACTGTIQGTTSNFVCFISSYVNGCF